MVLTRTCRILLGILFLVSCAKEDIGYTPEFREFQMGFTTWSYDATIQAVNDTYGFIDSHSDVYTEHIDNTIPWNAWINDLDLPTAFTNEIQGRVEKRLQKDLLLSIGLMNNNRDELAEDVDGSIPTYTSLSDQRIEDAYFKHVRYLVDQLNPRYLVISIEANELRLRAPEKWQGYTQMIQAVKARIKALYPTLPISESVSLHNLYQGEEQYVNEMIGYMNQMDFVAISYYPFLLNQHSQAEFRATFEFLHSRINQPISFSETGQIAENLLVPGLGVDMSGDEAGQLAYLEVLLEQAANQDYGFIVWWAHRDYDALWETFPAEVRDIGQLWRDTGLLNEGGVQRQSFNLWTNAFNN